MKAIQDLLREGIWLPDLVLSENARGSTCKPVRIRRSDRCVFISFNAKVPFTPKGEPICIKDRLFPLFDPDVEGVARMCDYWILCERDDERPVLYVFLCELKSGDPGGLGQLENGKLLAEHFVNMVAYHRKLAPRVEYRGIVFSPRFRGPKAGLKPGPIRYADKGRLPMPVAFLGDGTEYHLAALCT